jgi:hypothetical protein
LKSSPYYKNRLKRKPEQNIKEHPDEIKKYQEYMRATWFGENKTSVYFNYMKIGLLVDNTHNIKRAIKDIHKCNIFDDHLESINKKYKVLQERYPEVVNPILETLFPGFFRDIIREQYMKNITR